MWQRIRTPAYLINLTLYVVLALTSIHFLKGFDPVWTFLAGGFVWTFCDAVEQVINEA